MNDKNPIEKIDLKKTDWKSSRDFFQSLEDELRNLDDKDEKYDFTWVGKRKSIIEAGTPINKTLRPDEKNSKNWDTTENLYIEGDNLDALKLLQESYLGKVKMIYIDPPYNTGKDFVYHDNFKANIEEYDKETEYKDEEGNIQFKKNEKSNGRYHSDWLSMMYSRLKLARNLLTDDGVIFISIDDNEQANLKKLCDDIFGEENFISVIIWRKKYGIQNDAKYYSTSHEYIIMYAKNIELFNIKPLPRTIEQDARYKNYDNDSRGPWKSGDMSVGRLTQKDVYVITNPAGIKIYPPKGRCWRISKEKFENLVKDNRIWFGKNGDNVPSLKRFLSEVKDGQTPTTFWDYGEVGHTDGSNKALKKLFNGEAYFDYPKPTELIKRMLILSTSRKDIILDFFSGSSTTAHAVMQLNAEDGGNRKWIMVQLPEETPENSEAKKAGYSTIPDIARERIRRAGDKIAKENPEAKVDYGFRSLVVTDTNYKEVFKPVNEVTQESLLGAVDNIKEDRTPLDLLYGVLIQLALELNRPIETRKIDDSTIYLYDYFGEASGLIACFSDKVSEDAIKHIASLKPLTAVFKDSSFEDSQSKVNLSEHFRIISPNTKVRVI